MPIKQFRNVGKIGVISDVDPYDLPDDAWSSGQNIRFENGYAVRFKGHSQVFGSASVVPYWMLPVQTSTTYYWLYAGLNKAYATDGTTHSNITRQQTTNIATISTGNPTSIDTSAVHNLNDGETVTIAGVTGNTPDINGSQTATVVDTDTFTIPVNTTIAGSGGTVTGDHDFAATADKNWTGGVITGIPVINNGVDHPMMWSPPSTSTRLAPLTYDSGNTWADMDYTCGAMRPFKSFLVALDVTKGSTRYPHMVKWSHPATAGAVPSTWDETDATADAAEKDLSQTGGDLVDCMSLKGENIIYKEDATISMQYVGGNEIFTFTQLFNTVGMISRRCAVDFFGKHLVLTAGDIVVHDGHTVQSIVDKKRRDWLFSNIDATNFGRSFIVPNYNRNEVWICFPQNGSSLPDMAMVWNFKDNTFGVRELPNTPHIAYGIVDPSEDQTWDADSGTWDSDSSTWDERSYNPTIYKLLLASTNFFLGDDTESFDGTAHNSYVERIGLDFGDSARVKHIKAIYPRIVSGGSITFEVGSQMIKNGPITWTIYTYDPSSEEKVDVRVAGKYIGFRVGNSAAIDWELNSFDVEFDFGGMR